MNDLMNLERRIVDLYTEYDSQVDYERCPFVPTHDALEDMKGCVLSLQAELADLQQGGSDSIGNVLLHHLDNLLIEMDVRLRTDRSFPHRFVSRFTRRITALINLDARDDEARERALRAVLDAGPEVIRAAGLLAESIPGRRRLIMVRTLEYLPQMAERTIAVLRESFPYANAAHLNLLADKFSRLIGAADEVRAGLRSDSDGGGRDDVCRGPGYGEILSQLYGIDLADVSEHHNEWVQCRAGQLEDLAREIDASRDAFTILQEDLPPFDSPEEMFAGLRVCRDVAREKSQQYVDLPAGETCEIWRVPNYLRATHPWGGYLGGGEMLTKSLRGAVFLNHHNYQCTGRGWIQVNAVHECYPGHHTQHVRTSAADMPRSFKLRSGMVGSGRAAALSEGIALRSEQLLQHAFDESAFPLFVAYRRLLMAVRVSVDLLLHRDRGGREAAVQLYRRCLELPRSAALSQVYSQEMHPGYFTVHHYGMRALEQLYVDSGWDERPFTELAFSCGKVSPQLLRRLMDLQEDERHQLLGHFSALVEKRGRA